MIFACIRVLITHGKTLQGIFTDGDLRRVLETLALNSNSLEGQQNIQDITIGAVMTSETHFSPTWRFFKLSLIPARTRFKEITNWTKIGFCAKTAAKTNTNTVIASGKTNNVLTRLHTGETIGTFIYC
jgi:hypothetical protein